MPKNRADLIDKNLEFLGKYGACGAFPIGLGPIPVLCMVSPENIKAVIGSSRHMTKGFLYESAKLWLGTGLLTSEGTKWKTRRRMITPAFHFDILKRFLEVMNEQTDILVNKMEEKAQQGPVEAFGLITLCTLDIICETAMGKKVHAQQTEGRNEYVEAVYLSSKLIIDRADEPWTMFDWVYDLTAKGKENRKVLKILHGFARQVIKERRELIAREDRTQPSADGKKFRPAFLDILLTAESDGKPLDNEDIREEVDTFMFEGK